MNKLNIQELFKSSLNKLNLNLDKYLGNDLQVFSPINGEVLCTLSTNSTKDIEKMIDRSHETFNQWKKVPAPLRGELVRLFGNYLSTYKETLATIVSIECGKIETEALGEVQEMIDMAYYACGLSRMFGGKTLPSERTGHILQENWHSLGPVGVISAFNFPVAVWAWNSVLSLVCGDSVIWKPSELTPISALCCQQILNLAIESWSIQNPEFSIPFDLSQVIIGEYMAGEQLVKNSKIALVSATGSCRMGRQVKQAMAKDLGRNCLLELGGNNAVVVSEHARLDLALQSVLFGACGTSGQRCTSTRRVIVHEKIADEFWHMLKESFGQINLSNKNIGHPLNKKTLMGPLIHQNSFLKMQDALEKSRQQGGEVFYGQRVNINDWDNAYYVAPALVDMRKCGQVSIVKEETFAPILYVMTYKTLDEAIDLLNGVTQGLSGSIITDNIIEAQEFMASADTGLANVNIGTSGAEIGGAFGGNKDTGLGREAGSDSWKQYMRRSTNTLYFSHELPRLAQGVTFQFGHDN